MSTETDDSQNDSHEQTEAPPPSEDQSGANGQAPGATPEVARRPGKLALGHDDSLHRALSVAFADMITYARSMVGEVDRDPARAVHEYRKSLRRARALVKMLADALGEQAAAELTDTLRRAQRATSDVRDGDVMRAQLQQRADTKGWRKLVPELEQGLDAPEHGAAYARSVIEMGAGLIDGLPARFEQALPADIGWDAVGAGLKATYRRARNKLETARTGGDPEALHDFRKRAKELTYQLELLAAGQRGKLRKAHRKLAGLSEKLGDITDLELLRAHVAPQGEGDAGEVDPRRRKLARRVARTIERRTSKALSRGRDLFKARPRRFADKVVKRRQRR
jgi:CHAD domain-containing protein